MDKRATGHIVESLEAADAKSSTWAAPRQSPMASFTPRSTTNKGSSIMTKSLDVITEAVRNPKHPFRKVDNQPKKPLKHRYERRKIKEYLHLSDFVTGDVALSSGAPPQML